MERIIFLLLAVAVGFSSRAQAPQLASSSQAKPKVKTVFNPEMLALMLDNSTLPSLRKIYGKAVQVKKIIRNKYEPSVKDTLLTVANKIDKLEIFANQYNQFLLSADVTSKKMSFGRAIRIGSSKADFCKAYGLPAAFDAYQITDEGTSSLYFIFKQGLLAKVTFDAGGVE
ncbi:hypothetical protein [Hymenobacter cheonanensis]|uniref:hypothetical protein n=1 Tax=Hymenobacter sp. CA2-7 TaxID=3063993 RepID=UPI002712FF0B|nr:hypothetical protein [Hymenobacter sp. CA2-7]MDO7887592.1 hypothetical protein [Hymenobacter sp. CA2-7]